MKVLYFTLSAGSLNARYLLRANPGGDLTVVNVPDDASTAAVVNLVNLTAINAPAKPIGTPEVDYAQLGRGKIINLVKRGRPTGSGEGRTERMDWRTTAERKRTIKERADAAGLSVAAWLDSLVDRARK